MKFSIGYNYDIRILDFLGFFKKNIEAIYFPIPSQYLGSGRYSPQPKNYLNEVDRLVRKCKSLKIRSQLLLNETCEGSIGLEEEFFSKIIDYIQKLRRLGLNSVIITNPVYISEIKKRFRGLTIESSVNCYVQTVEHALYLKDLGVDILTIDRDINRNIPLIKEIKKKTGLKIRIMLNEGCLRNCPFRKMHYNYLSHRATSSQKLIEGIFPDKFSIRILKKNPERVFNIPFIPPEALKYYHGAVDYYKLSTRVLTTARIESCLRAYINQKFNDNLLDLLDSPCLSCLDFIDYNLLKKNNFFAKISKCHQDCLRCNYCNNLKKEALIINDDFLNKHAKINERRKKIKIYNKTLKNAIDKDTIYLNLSKTYFSLKEYFKAIKAAKMVIKKIPLKLSNFRKKIISYKEIRDMNKKAELDYKKGNAHLLLGFCYEKIKKYGKAIGELKKAEELNFREPQINYSLFNCYRHTGQIEQANKTLDKAVINLKESKAGRNAESISFRRP